MFANGAVHWTASTVGKESVSDLVVAFDLGVEEFRIMPQPDYWDDDHEMNVGVLGGCLYVLCTVWCLQVEIWMKKYGLKESWSKLCTVITQLLVKPFYLYVRPLAYSKSCDKVLPDWIIGILFGMI